MRTPHRQTTLQTLKSSETDWIPRVSTQPLRFHARASLLIVDEIGYRPITQGGANLFFQLVNARYEKGAMILTSNRGFAEWGEVFGDPVVATALLDRLLQHAFDLDDNSVVPRRPRSAGNQVSVPQPCQQIPADLLAEDVGKSCPVNRLVVSAARAKRPSSFEVAVAALRASRLASNLTGTPCLGSPTSWSGTVSAAPDRKAAVSRVSPRPVCCYQLFRSDTF